MNVDARAFLPQTLLSLVASLSHVWRSEKSGRRCQTKLAFAIELNKKSSATKQVIELSFPAIVAISAPRHSYTHWLRLVKTRVDWAWVLAKNRSVPFLRLFAR